jgi:hypothetical protein
MDYYKTFATQLKKKSKPEAFWKALLAVAAKEKASSNLDIIAKMDLAKQSKPIANRIAEKLRTSPLPKEIKSIYFGLFEGEDDYGPVQGFYVCGSTKTRKSGGEDFMVGPAWKPRWCYFRSKLLDKIIRASQGFDLAAKPVKEETCVIGYENGILYKWMDDGRQIKVSEEEKRELDKIDVTASSGTYDPLFGEFLALGAAMAIVKALPTAKLFPRREIHVGFDAGDILRIA